MLHEEGAMWHRASFVGHGEAEMRREHSLVSRECVLEARKRVAMSRERWGAPESNWGDIRFVFVESWGSSSLPEMPGAERRDGAGEAGERGLCSECVLVMRGMFHETQEGVQSVALDRSDVPSEGDAPPFEDPERAR